MDKALDNRAAKPLDNGVTHGWSGTTSGRLAEPTLRAGQPMIWKLSGTNPQDNRADTPLDNGGAHGMIRDNGRTPFQTNSAGGPTLGQHSGQSGNRVDKALGSRVDTPLGTGLTSGRLPNQHTGQSNTWATLANG